MRIQAYEDTPAIMPARNGFRSGEIRFHDVMSGTEGTPENYGLQVVHVLDRYATPQHRHNFEQVRVMLDGEFGFGPGQVQRKGSVGYFCEGTYYTQNGDRPSTTLLLQMGGPSGQGFMSRAQLLRGIAELRERGSFAEGVYTWVDEQGKKHNQDSYEAVWEHVHGRRVAYPKPQYLGPVLLEPERFAWKPAQPGVDVRELGAFNGCGLSLVQWRLQAGAEFTPDASQQPVLLFALEGSGRAADQDYRRWTSLEIGRGERVALAATSATEWFAFRLPGFESRGHAAGS
jgi:hypothetical protein